MKKANKIIIGTASVVGIASVVGLSLAFAQKSNQSKSADSNLSANQSGSNQSLFVCNCTYIQQQHTRKEHNMFVKSIVDSALNKLLNNQELNETEKIVMANLDLGKDK